MCIGLIMFWNIENGPGNNQLTKSQQKIPQIGSDWLGEIMGPSIFSFGSKDNWQWILIIRM